MYSEIFGIRRIGGSSVRWITEYIGLNPAGEDEKALVI